MGLTRTYAGLLVCRILLGVFEAGFFPGRLAMLDFQVAHADRAKAVSISYQCITSATSCSGASICFSAQQSWQDR